MRRIGFRINHPWIGILLIVFSGCSVVSEGNESRRPDTEQTLDTQLLWHQQPASKWVEALPVGNGRLGAMVFGGVENERIQLNEDTLWAGPPVPQDRIGAYEHIEKARKLIFEGKYTQGQKVMQDNVMAPRISPRSYQTLGDLRLTIPGVTSDIEVNEYAYRRELNLDTAIATTTFTKAGVRYKREVFSSSLDDVLVVRLTADKKKSITVDVLLDRPADFNTHTEGDDTIIMHGQASQNGKHLGVKYVTRLLANTKGGKTLAHDEKLSIKNADSVTLYLAAATDYNFTNPYQPLQRDLAKTCTKKIQTAAKKPYAKLRQDHISEHQRLFRRVALNLGKTDSALSDKPTNERLNAVKKAAVDPELVALYFQFGRYLLITSSRPGCMPANLQGIWNEHLKAPWNSDYHININMQMNYWPAEVCNLSECHEPLFDFIECLVQPGRKTAKDVYNCRGFVAHHTTDAWHFTTPFGRAQYGMWPMGAGWCTQHFMERYRFTGDRRFLKKRGFPILKEAALFYLDWLTKDPKSGKLMSGPSVSPENSFIAPDGKRANLDMGASMDQQIIWDVFTNCIEAAEVLEIEDEFIRDVKKARTNMFMPKIGKDGRLMEWTREFDEPQPGHRHMSHLYGLHPGRQYTFQNTPELMTAARKSIEHRLAHGGGHTGWSRAWIINFWARLRDADKAYENVIALLRKSTHPNLFDNHPPFQIDGNFGGIAGIAEMLLQSHAHEIHLLPALPAAWPNGSVKGLCARGGFVIDISWQNGKLSQAVVHSRLGNPCRLRFGDQTVDLSTQAGKSYSFNGTIKKNT
jgi:alpha-L-fucosidase 2